MIFGVFDWPACTPAVPVSAFLPPVPLQPATANTMVRGAGFVTDGGLRDGHVLASLPFATYARAVTITTRAAFHHVADLQVPIACAGVAVYPGDVLVGDRDGVVVIPRALAADIAGPSLEQEQLEEYLHTRVKAGEALWGIYPPTDQTKAEYQAYRDASASGVDEDTPAVSEPAELG